MEFSKALRYGNAQFYLKTSHTCLGYWTSRGYRLCRHTITYQIIVFKYARRNINKWLNNNIQLHFIMKHFNMTQRCVLCPDHHLLKATTTTGDIRELSSYRFRCCRCDEKLRAGAPIYVGSSRVLMEISRSLVWKPNSITLVGSGLVRSWFEADCVMEFGFKCTSLPDFILRLNSNNRHLPHVTST